MENFNIVFFKYPDYGEELVYALKYWVKVDTECDLGEIFENAEPQGTNNIQMVNKLDTENIEIPKCICRTKKTLQL